jgi:hypothetical protein
MSSICPPARNRPSRNRPAQKNRRDQPLRPGPGRRVGLAVRSAVMLAIGLAPLGALGCGADPPGSVAKGCQDLAGSQGQAGGDIWGEVAADAHGTSLGSAASGLEKLSMTNPNGTAYRGDLRQVITLCGKAGITV